MLCPVCEIEMLVLEYSGIEIDFCQKCEGIWLDEGELELLLDENQKKHSALFHALLERSKKTKGLDRKCPVCGKRMTAVELPLSSPLEIDKCVFGHGLWFDKGELYQICSSISPDEAVSNFLKDMFRLKGN